MNTINLIAGDWLGDGMDGPPKWLVADVLDGVVTILDREPTGEDTDAAMYREAARLRRERIARNTPDLPP